MNCGFCGIEIDEKNARHACAACPLHKSGCKRLKCPRCGYENPETPAFIRRLTEWRDARERRRERAEENA